MSNLGWEVEVDHISSHRWSQAVDQFVDANVYQTAAYGEVRWGAKNLSRLLLKRNGTVTAAAQFRIIRPTPLKFGIAYLRWGPMWERRDQPMDAEIAKRMAEAIEQEYLRKRKLCVQILPNAFAGTDRADLFTQVFPGFAPDPTSAADEYRTFLLDLTSPLEKLRAGFDAKWRNKLNQAEKNGLTIEAGRDVGAFRQFADMYREMWKRKAFETTVNIDEFEQMQQSLPESQRLQVLIGKSDGVAVAGVVVAAVGDTAIYILGATGDAGLKTRGSYLLQWTAMRWLKERGVKRYDLGGINPEVNPGVYSFKKGFSGEDVRHIDPLIRSEHAMSLGFAKAAFTLRHKLRSPRKSQVKAQNEREISAAS